MSSTNEPTSFTETLTKPFKKDKLTINVSDKPSIEDLKQFEKEEKFCFKFNNKAKNAYIDCHKDEDYYMDFYRTFGKPYVY